MKQSIVQYGLVHKVQAKIQRIRSAPAKSQGKHDPRSDYRLLQHELRDQLAKTASVLQRPPKARRCWRLLSQEMLPNLSRSPPGKMMWGPPNVEPAAGAGPPV
jgi:hypothetical protein